mgnify:CR=1 FL=1
MDISAFPTFPLAVSPATAQHGDPTPLSVAADTPRPQDFEVTDHFVAPRDRVTGPVPSHVIPEATADIAVSNPHGAPAAAEPAALVALPVASALPDDELLKVRFWRRVGLGIMVPLSLTGGFAGGFAARIHRALAPAQSTISYPVNLPTSTGGAVTLAPSKPTAQDGDLAPLLAAADAHRQQAFEVMDRFVAARDPVTGLIPLHVTTDESGQLVPTDHVASGLDAGRATSGLVMVSRLAREKGDEARAARYLEAAEANYEAAKRLLTQGDIFVHLRDFNDDGSVKSTSVGEQGSMTRVNPRGYAFRGAADLYLATGKPAYKADLERYFTAWVKDFHDDQQGGFFIHADASKPGDHTESGPFRDPGGKPSSFTGTAGAKGNDGAIYALSGVLLPANQALATPQTQKLVREQMDIILDRFQCRNGMLWENYTNDFDLVSEGWQNQDRDSSNGQPAPSSHVAIGGHTAMASQQIIEGALQLRAQGALTQAECDSYLKRATALFQDFATTSGAVDWSTGAVHNAMRVEEPDSAKRWIRPWGDVSWQQAELLQTLLDLRETGHLQDIRGPQGETGADLLARAESYYEKTYPIPAHYTFDGFGNPDVYHVPQVAAYFQQALDAAEPRR